MKLISVESPFAPTATSTTDEHIRYARKACRFVALKGYSPYASHLFFTQPGILDDTIPEERELGIKGGKAWEVHAEESWFFLDYGMTKGMKYGLDEATRLGRGIRFFRFIDGAFVQQEGDIFWDNVD